VNLNVKEHNKIKISGTSASTEATVHFPWKSHKPIQYR